MAFRIVRRRTLCISVLAKFVCLLSSSWGVVVALPTFVDGDADLSTETRLNGGLLVIGGYREGANTNGRLEGQSERLVEVYNGVKSSSTLFPSLPESRCGHGSATLNGLVYVVGGFNRTPEVVATVYVYRPGADKWSTTTPMQTPRVFFGVAVLASKLYAVGGSSQLTWSSGTTSSVEVFDPIAAKWTFVKKMQRQRRAHGVAVVGGLLYAVGGVDEHQMLLDTAERYDPRSDEWSAIESMDTARYKFAVGVLNGLLYTIGGITQSRPGLLRKGSHIVSAVDVYNSTVNRWQRSQPLNAIRASAAAIAYEGRLFVVGGTNDNVHGLSSVEMLDPSSMGVWNLLPSTDFKLSIARFYISLAVL